MSEEINIAGQLKFASQHLFNLIVFIGILYYFLKDIVVKFFSNRSLKISKEIEEANAKERSARLAQVGTGDRSEKIRTYNYKDNRTTDHRLGINFPLEQVLAGQLEDVIGACIAEEQKRQMEELSNQSED